MLHQFFHVLKEGITEVKAQLEAATFLAGEAVAPTMQWENTISFEELSLPNLDPSFLPEQYSA